MITMHGFIILAIIGRDKHDKHNLVFYSKSNSDKVN